MSVCSLSIGLMEAQDSEQSEGHQGAKKTTSIYLHTL